MILLGWGLYIYIHIYIYTHTHTHEPVNLMRKILIQGIKN